MRQRANQVRLGDAVNASDHEKSQQQKEDFKESAERTKAPKESKDLMSPIFSVCYFPHLYSAIRVGNTMSRFCRCPSQPVDATSKGETRDTDAKTRIQVGVDRGPCIMRIDSDGDACLACRG